MEDDQWTQNSAGLDCTWFKNLTPTWQRNNALRSDLSRRQALLEIDVLTAHAMKLTFKELLTLYRMRFRVMRSYEENTWYDQNGRIVFTTNVGLPGVGLPNKARSKDVAEGITYAINGQKCDERGLGFDNVRWRLPGAGQSPASPHLQESLRRTAALRPRPPPDTE